MTTPAKPKCLVPSCTEPAKWKGVCGKCYHQAKKLIDDGQTTWEELAEMGLVTLPDQKLLTAFLDAKKRKDDASPEAEDFSKPLGEILKTDLG